MSYFFPYPLLTLLLALPPQQEATPLAPSVADAARAARERQKAATAKHVVTDDDVAHSGAGTLPPGVDETQLRAELENSTPKILTVDWLRLVISQLSDYQKNAASIPTRWKRTPMGSNENADFPGKKEWEEQMETAAQRLIEEAGKSVSRLQAILDQNQEALSGRNPAAMPKIREEYIDAMVPYTSWNKRAFQLMVDGGTRVRAAAAKAQAQPR